MANEFHVKRAYIEACEYDWSRGPRSKNHTSFNSSKVLKNVKAGKTYLQELGSVLKLDLAPGWDAFKRTLCLNIELSGPSATEFKQFEFAVGGKNGAATYLLVATNVDYNSAVTICYSYHYIEEHIENNDVFTFHSADMTLHWLRAKSCQNIASMLPSYAAPRLIIE